MRKTKKNFRKMLGILMAIAVMLCMMTAAAAQITAAEADSPAVSGQAIVQALSPAVGDAVIGNTNNSSFLKILPSVKYACVLLEIAVIFISPPHFINLSGAQS